MHQLSLSQERVRLPTQGLARPLPSLFLYAGAAFVCAGALIAAPIAWPSRTDVIERAARDAVAHPVRGRPLEDPTPVLDALSQDPVARAFQAEHDAIDLLGRRWPGPQIANPDAPLNPVIADKAATVLTAWQRADQVSATPIRVRIINFLRFLRPRDHFAAPPAPPPLADIQSAIWEASAATGVSPDYLLRAARRESSLNPGAAASTSSARGLFQFIDSTWLLAVRDYGPRNGLAREAAMISVDSAGRPYVADPIWRAHILSLRSNPAFSARLAGEVTRNNATQLARFLGRAPYAGELYVAHVLGAAGAVRLMAAAQRTPQAPAARIEPGAALANHALFFSGARLRSAQEVLWLLYVKGESA